MKKSINLAEIDDMDTLYMYSEVGDKSISIAVCPDDDNLISLVLCKPFSQIFLNKKEARLISDTLKEISE